jgi:hypothetical protein
LNPFTLLLFFSTFDPPKHLLYTLLFNPFFSHPDYSSIHVFG